MKRLFVVDSNYDIDLNREWLHLVPEFSKILHRRWLCEGDADGRKKVMARRVFGYVYLTMDFASPLFTWAEEAAKTEALKMMKLKEGDIQSEGVQAAITEYARMQDESAPALPALRAMHAAARHMNEYLKTIDLTKVDKMGKPLHTPASITRAIKEMNAMYDSIAAMERRVMEDLRKESNTIRGTATLGGKEGKRRKEWKEGAGPTETELQKSVEKALDEGKTITAVESEGTTMQGLGAYLNALTREEDEE